MAQTLTSTLSSLRDVDGIVGSFVVNSDGELIAQDLPAYFAGVAEEVGPRVLRLRDALALSEGPVSACTVRYANHKLSFRSVPGAVLAVLAVATVNAPALRMAMNLVARKCASEDLSSYEPTSSRIPPVVSSAPPPPVAPVPPVAAVAAVSPNVPSAPPPRPSAPAFGTATLPSVPVSDVTAAALAARSAAPPASKPAEIPESGEKKRAVYFRGKRIG